MAYRQNPGRGKSDSYASMLSKGLINEPTKKRTHVEKDGVIHKIIGDHHIKSPSGKIIRVEPNEWKNLYKQTDYDFKRNLEDIRLIDQGDERTKEEMIKKRKLNQTQKDMITHQANEMQKIFDAQQD